MTQNTTPFLLNLNPSLMDEPSVSNDEFLDSLDVIGVWLRVVSAFDSLERYTSPDSTSTQRLAALSNIYIQLGAQLEDQAVSLVAFSVWSKNRNLVLADLFSRIIIRRPKKSAFGTEIEQVHERLRKNNSKAVPVDAGAFFQEVSEMSDPEIVEFFLGYRWRREPSVRLIPKRHIEVWRKLPGELRRIASSYYNERQIPRLTAAYNKLKHGPQIIIQNPVQRARRFGKSPELATQLAEFESFDKLGVRLLFAGANTKSSLEVGTSRSVAPFLVDDEVAARKLFFETMVGQANLFQLFVQMQIALYRKTRISFGSRDDGISRILDAQGRYMRSRRKFRETGLLEMNWV